MASSSVKKGRRSPSLERPNMSDLRIVLLGKNVTENSRVGNSIIGRAAFESEADVELHIEIKRGKLKDRDITVINTAHLLNPDLSGSQITQGVRETVDLSAPGPHVIILVLQQNDFSDTDRNRVRYVLNEFSEEAIKHTIVLTTEEEIHNNCIHQLRQECGGGHLQFDEQQLTWLSEILESTEKILKEQEAEFLICELYVEAREETSGDEEQIRSEGSVKPEEKEDSDEAEGGEIKQSKTKEVAVQSNIILAEGVYSFAKKLNVVLCGRDGALKSTVSNLILNQGYRRSELSSECVKLEGDVHGRLINLVELPALTRLSQEEVMRQSLRCVSLCDPGVHVFLLVMPDGPLTDENKREAEEIQKMFSSKINKHTMVLIIQKSEREPELNEAVQCVIECFGGRHHYLDQNTQVSMLVTELKQMVEENVGICFSTETFLDAQMEIFEEIRKKISLQTKIRHQVSVSDDVRIVLLGKTGVGKSASANTILGREAFKEDVCQESVTKECQKESTQIDGRSVTVIDTPGLFDTNISHEEIQREITNCISMILPGPHVFLLLIPVGRFTQEEENSVKIIQETFGENSLMYTIVLFTGGDGLKRKSIEEYLGKPGSPLMNLIGQCGNRYHVFNNKTGDRMQVSKLLEKINDMVAANGGSYYTCKMFRQMEREKQERETKMLMDKEEKLEREKEEILVKHKEENEKMKMMMEEERQNHDSERKRREEEFSKNIKEKEEQLKKCQRDISEREKQMEREKRERDKERDMLTDAIQKEKSLREKYKMFRQMEKEKQERETKMLMDKVEKLEREKEEILVKHKEENERMKMMMEEQTQNHDSERKRREEEFSKNIKEKEEQLQKCQREISEREKQMEGERKERDKQHDMLTNIIQNEKSLREEQCKMFRQMEREKQETHERLMDKVKELEKEREEILLKHKEENEKMKMMIQNEKSLREEQHKIFEDKIKFLEQQRQDEQMKSADYEEDRRKDMENMKMCCSQTASSLQTAETDPTVGPKNKEELEVLYDRLDLTNRYQDKMKTAEILQISSFQCLDPQKETELVNSFLQKLMSMNYRARDLVRKHRQKEGEEDNENQKPDIHPVDVQMAVFHCSDGFLKQLMVTKLSQCQYALPLLVPDPFTQQIEFPLWTFRLISKSWKMKNTNSEIISQTQPVYKAQTPMVFFFRFDSVSLSKSQLVNSIINEKHNTFFHRNCSGSSKTRLLMDGVVEIAWYCPSGENTDTFDDCVAFCNLHGDAADNEKQYEILSSMASVNVVFLPDFGQKNQYKGLVRSLFKSPQPLICCLTDNECDETKLGNGKFTIGLLNKNQADASKQIGEIIRESLTEQKKTFRLEDVVKHTGIRVDEDDPECRRGKQAALQIMTLLRGEDPSTVKETHLPCQGKLWHDWCKMNKELHHLTGENIEEDKSTKMKNMQDIRQKQREQGFGEFMRKCIETMNSQKDDEKKYFLRWMINLLDDFTSDHLCRLHKQYAEKWEKILELKRMPDNSDQLQTEQTNLEKISEQINKTHFGLEHILREFGQIYESCSSVKNKDGQMFDFRSLPSLAAEMMISGFPMELMDGDAAHVPLTWVTAVLDHLINKLGDQKVFVLSVLGIQSSGKSTMLNALFGLQFAVSAGRCTRGAFMQLVKVSEEMKEQLKFEYILVVDTEGLRPPELSGRSTTHRDNEMATFVVGLGNMTLINIFGENPSEMQDILQIVVQAFMRMNQIRLNPRCMFVHQNVSDITAGEKNMEGRRRLQDKLDEMTKLAAREEDSDAERFSDVIMFDVQKDVKYFAQLWEGSPPMAPPNPNYCENIRELKKSILNHASESDGIMLTHFRERIGDLWEALLNEQFVFSFKNSLEIATYKKLETEYSKWTWSLRSAMLEIENKLHNKIENEAIEVIEETDLQSDLNAKGEEVKKTMSEFFEKDREADMLKQWKASFEIKIKELQGNIVRETQRKLNAVLQQRHLKKQIDAQKTQHENTLFEKSKEFALQLKDQANDENVMKTQFDLFWKQQTAQYSNNPLVKDIDILKDMKNHLCENYKGLPVDRMEKSHEHKDMSCLPSYSKYVQLKKSTGFTGTLRNVFHAGKEMIGRTLSEDDEVQIRALIRDIDEQANKMFQSFNFAKMGYNKSCVQQLADYIQASIMQHQEEPDVKYKFKEKLFIDLVLYICQRANKTFTVQYKMFREANDPVLYLERKRQEYYRIFQRNCQGASSTAIFGEFVCNKLKEPIQQNVYKKTARDLADEMKTDCESLNGNRSNLEKHILKILAEKQDFEAYVTYIDNPREHFKDFIRDQVSQYITGKFEDSVRPKMENSITLLEQKIMNAVHESSKQADAQLWLRRFTEQLSGELVFSANDLTGVNYDDVKVRILEDVMKKEVPSIMSEIRCTFSTETFSVKLEHKDRPDEILINHLCSCCWVQCPFCAAICTNTIADHPGDHSVPFHRNTGLNGWSYKGTTNLSISICTSAVASDRHFFNSSDDSVPWKKYRTAGPKYATWRITPDLSELPYWNWFVCRFQKDLEKHYGKTYEGSGEIPEEWRKYSLEEAIESLDKYI